MFWAARADTVDSIELGTRNTKLMTFSTMPTAAASSRPRPLAMTVISRKEIWIKPSCKATGTPTFRMEPRTSFRGRKLALVIGRADFCRVTITRDTTTLRVWDRVVPRAAPAGPRCIPPMNR